MLIKIDQPNKKATSVHLGGFFTQASSINPEYSLYESQDPTY